MKQNVNYYKDVAVSVCVSGKFVVILGNKDLLALVEGIHGKMCVVLCRLCPKTWDHNLVIPQMSQ